MNILGKSVTELKSLLERKELSKEELFQYFNKRIVKYNPSLNAFLTETNYEVSMHTNLSGQLSGIPLSVKDNFCTRGVRTTASSKVLDNFIAPYNATVIEKLEKAGYSLLGKTNMDAWAHGSSTETSDYGPTKNPWDLSRVPGGSSGGSAASVAAYLSPASIGTETSGSIRQPAAWSGVVGLKSTYGRISRYGIIAMGSSFDGTGMLTRTVADAALFLEILAGHDMFDATSSKEPVKQYSNLMKEKKKFTIGICKDYLKDVDEEIKKKFEETIKILEKLGHTVKKIKLIDPSYAISVYTILQRSEVSSNLGRYDGIRYGNDRSSFGEEAKRRIMLGTYTLSHGYYDAYYKKAQKVRTLIIDDFKKAFKDVDVILAPTTPMTALKIGEWEKYPFFGEVMDVLNNPAAVAGIPAVNIPVGLDKKNLPIGMQFMGSHFAESTLLNIAYQFEKETDFFGVTKKILEKYPD